MFDNVPPEILSTLDIEYLDPDNNDGKSGKKIIPQLSSYLQQDKSIIQILTESRENKDNNVYESIDNAIINMYESNNDTFRVLYRSVVTKSENKSIIEVRQFGDTIESIIINDLTKINNVKIYSDNNTVIYDSFCDIDYSRTKEYKIHSDDNKSEIKVGLLLSNYNIPIISMIYNKIFMEIEFGDEYESEDTELLLVYACLNIMDRKLLSCIQYELDMQPGKFIIFDGGLFVEHFTHDMGDLSKQYQAGTIRTELKKIFDAAHKEALRRKEL